MSDGTITRSSRYQFTYLIEEFDLNVYIMFSKNDDLHWLEVRHVRCKSGTSLDALRHESSYVRSRSLEGLHANNKHIIIIYNFKEL